jgi:DNA-binding NarL/FixJ family response regulator
LGPIFTREGYAQPVVHTHNQQKSDSGQTGSIQAEDAMQDPKTETTVMIVEDHPLYAAGMQELVEFVITDARIVHAQGLNDAINLMKMRHPTLIIADLHLGDSEGLDTAKALHAESLGVPILFMSGDEGLLPDLLRLNLHKCYAMPKTGDFYQTSHMLTDCISRAGVVANWRNPNSSTGGRPNSLQRGRREVGGRIQLTQKQREVMLLLLNGLSNKEIARQLSLSPETVKTHLREIFTRMNVRNRTQAVSLFKKAPSLSNLTDTGSGN